MVDKNIERLEKRKRAINAVLKRIGVPFALEKIGNYKEGEFELTAVNEDCVVSNQYVVTVMFFARAPYTGKEVTYVVNFNRHYSPEAEGGMIVIPIVNGNFFMMVNSYGPATGRFFLTFPKGFIPASDRVVTAKEVAMDILNRNGLEAIYAWDGKVVSEPRLLCDAENQKYKLIENSSTGGSWITLGLVRLEVDFEAFLNKEKKFRYVEFVEMNEFDSFIRRQRICDLHALSAYSVFCASRQS